MNNACEMDGKHSGSCARDTEEHWTHAMTVMPQYRDDHVTTPTATIYSLMNSFAHDFF